MHRRDAHDGAWHRTANNNKPHATQLNITSKEQVHVVKNNVLFLVREMFSRKKWPKKLQPRPLLVSPHKLPLPNELFTVYYNMLLHAKKS